MDAKIIHDSSPEHLAMGSENGSNRALKRQKSFWGSLRSYDGIQVCATVASIVLGLNVILAIVAFSIGYSKSSESGFLTVPLYNAVLLTSQSSNEYSVLVVPSDYTGSRPLSLPHSSECFQSRVHQSLADFNLDIANGRFDVLSKEQCLKTFAVSYPHGHRSLLVLSKNLTWDLQDPVKFAGNANSPTDYQSIESRSPASWMCPSRNKSVCTSSTIQKQLPEWKILASVLEEPTWTITAPLDNGSMTYTQENYTSCGRETSSCWNMFSLAQFLWGTTLAPTGGILPVTKPDLQQYLGSTSVWGGNITWAEGVVYRQSGSQCSTYDVLNTPNTIGYFDYPSIGLYTVDGCVSIKGEEKCQLLFNPTFSLVVLMCTAVKVACIVFVARRERTDRLLTVGDAISSFLSKRDPFTTGCCTSSKSDWIRRSRFDGAAQHRYEGVAQQRLDTGTRRWWQAAGIRQWALTLGLSLPCLGVAGFLLHSGLQDTRLDSVGGTNWSTLWNLGLGSASPYTLIYRLHTTLLGNVLLANTPQLLLSVSYYFYNATLTAMFMAHEYESYAIGGMRHDSTVDTIQMSPAKGLRVSSNRKGAQRSFYFLSLPFRYSVPLMLTYTALHWLLSQTIFYVQIYMYDADMYHDPSLDVDACAWSPIALIFTIIVGSLMIMALLGLAMRPFRSVIPLAGSCSAAISAACHPPEDDVDAALKPIMWGEIHSHSPSTDSFTPIIVVGKAHDETDMIEMQGKRKVMQGLPRCTFTSMRVERPTLFQTYE
ncbi:uncharacterized protein N7500_008901 [Penicillium coprophilum]|uniref:uncharacterized protein n=1 Tax=Penicillium coprophilum TaxID=36646 RepID=UPI0023863364|nr:uncharacterized protein N7500_008901 [Penicillium coprophilum]KAJ5159250.1 hypothetical protein N7500_008901 [Penicillium coprophilum]